MHGSTLYAAQHDIKPFASKDWANIWFEKLARYHRVYQPQHWEFDEQHVIAFLRSKLKAGVPAWKRLRIVEGLIGYRNRVRRCKTPALEPIRAKLQELALSEQHRDDDEPIEDVVGKIDPHDPDIIQQMQRTMRLEHRRPNTETAYLKWVRRFMRERCLKNASDFQQLGTADVEAFLTDFSHGDDRRAPPALNRDDSPTAMIIVCPGRLDLLASRGDLLGRG